MNSAPPSAAESAASHQHTPSPAGGDAGVVEQIGTPVADALGYEIVLVEFAGSGRRRILRVYIDRPQDDQSVGVDDCAQFSRALSNALDAAEAAAEAAEPILSAGEVAAGRVRAVLGAPYTLEVSSPGVDRPLTRRVHFERVLGQRIKVRCHEPPLRASAGDETGSDQRTFYGRLDAVEADPARPDEPRAGLITIQPEDRNEPLRLQLAQVQRANLVYEGI